MSVRAWFLVITFGVSVCRRRTIDVRLYVWGWSLFVLCFWWRRCWCWRHRYRISGSSYSGRIRLNLLAGWIVAEYWWWIFGGSKRLNRRHAQIVDYFVFYDWRRGHGRGRRCGYVQLLLQLLMLLGQRCRCWGSWTLTLWFGIAWARCARMAIRNVFAKGVFATRYMCAHAARITVGTKIYIYIYEIGIESSTISLYGLCLPNILMGFQVDA